MLDVTGPGDVDELAALCAAAEKRRAVRRQVADAVVDHGSRSPEAVRLRQMLRAVNAEWTELIRQAAAAGPTLADVARAAGVAAPSLYYRLRAPRARGLSPSAAEPGWRPDLCR